MSRSVAFDSLDEALAAHRLGPIMFTCAVCGRRHSTYGDGSLPGTANPCVRAVDTYISSAYAYTFVPGISRNVRCVVPPAWSLLHCGLPDRVAYAHCCGGYLKGCSAVPPAVMLMLGRQAFIEQVVAHRRIARAVDDQLQDSCQSKRELAERVSAVAGGIDMSYVGPPRLPLPVRLHLRGRGMATDANGKQVQLPSGITSSCLRAQLQQIYWPAYAFTDKDMSLTRDKLVGAILESDRIVLVLSGANKARTQHRTVAYPVVGYELMMPWRLWDREADLQGNFIDQVAETLQA